MREPTLIQSKTQLPVAEIRTEGRLRPVSPAGVAAILSSMDEVGQIVSPLTVRQKHRGGELLYELLDGAHRLAAAVERGLETVPVRVFDCTDDQARLMEIDGNLAGAELNALDTAVFLATRKAVYERLHPETRAMVGRDLAMKRWADASDIVSFASATAEKFGLSKRQVERMVAAGAHLQPDEIAALRSAPKPVTLKDLQVIAKSHATDRYFVVEWLSTGRARSAAEAIRLSKDPKPRRSDAEQKRDVLESAWSRASIAVRTAFVIENWSEIAGLMRSADAASDEDQTGGAEA